MNPFNIRSIYSFNVYPAALLNTSWDNVTVVAIMDPATAAKEEDIQALHIQVYPTLPAGTINDFKSYDYIKVQTVSGNTFILGIPWIIPSTVVLVESNTIKAVIGGVSANDVSRILNALVQNGYKNVTMSIN